MSRLTVTFLGTSAMVPTRERNVAAVLVDVDGEGILFDCGEGTQRQMRHAGYPPPKIEVVCISHWHADHAAGLIGLIQTIGGSAPDQKLVVYGPRGTRERLAHLNAAVAHYPTVAIEAHEIDGESLLPFRLTSRYQLSALALDHSVPCLGFVLKRSDRLKVDMDRARALGIEEGPQIGKLLAGEPVLTLDGRTIGHGDVTHLERGERLAYVTDTAWCDNLRALAEGADLLICESTFANEHAELAVKYRHLTAEQAGRAAHEAGVRRLVLTHVSQRYRDSELLRAEAARHFPGVTVAEDFLRIEL